MAVHMRSTGAIPDWREYVRDRQPRDILFSALAAEFIHSREIEGTLSREIRSRLRPSRDARDPGGAVWAAWHDMPVREISVEHVTAWIRALRAARAANTVLAVVSALSITLTYGVETGACEVNPCRMLPRGTLPRKEVRDPDAARLEVFSLDEARRIMQAHDLPPVHRSAWQGLLLTGMRWGELAALRWALVSTAREPLGEIVVSQTYDCRTRELRPTKSKIPRRVPIHPLMRRVLGWQLDWYRRELGRAPGGDDPVFPFRVRGGAPSRWHANTAIAAWRRDLARLGIPDPVAGPRRLHCTRHTFASHLYRAKAPWRVVQAMTHRVLDDKAEGTALPVYVHASWDDSCDAMMRLPYAASAPALRAV